MTYAESASGWVHAHQEQVGFALQLATVDTSADPGRHVLQSGQLAEQLGFDAVFLPDHPSWMPDCWVHLAALAVTTRRIRLGTGVACALYRHPVVLARQAADIDQLSGGRLILGLGAGWDAPEFARLGSPLPSVRYRQTALDETLTILRGVWGPAPFSFEGRCFSTVDAQVLPGPAQRPGPPILIAGGGERITFRQVAQYADACQLSDLAVLNGTPSPTALRAKHAALERHCAAVDRRYADILRTHFTGWLILAENERRLAAKVKRYMPDGLASRYSGEWSGFAVAATPEQAIAYFRARQAAGIQYFVVELMDASDVETVQLLADAVMPALATDGAPPS